MQDNYTQQLLRLKEVNITKISEEENLIEVHIESQAKSAICPCCHKPVHSIHDYRNQRIKHINFGLRHCELILRKKRFICKSCNKRFNETLEFLGRYQRRTKEVVIHMIEEAKETVSIKSIAKRFNVSSPTISRLLKHVALQSVKMPKVLCIDEFKGNAGGDKYQCILVDGINRKIVDTLPSRRLERLESYFSKVPYEQRKAVEYIVMDMYPNYSMIARKYFPNAQIVIDKFHFVRQCYWALENVRKNAQNKMTPSMRKYYKRSKSILRKKASKLKPEDMERLTTMLAYNEEIRKAYYLKECFYIFLNVGSKDKATLALNEWLKQAQNAALPDFKNCIRALSNWSDKILNYFDTGLTNAVTEGFNNKIKVIKRVSYGYRNFDNFRRRILLCCS